MALVKLSGVVSDIRGKIGGTTFKNSSAGLVMQTSTSPVNKNSLTQNIQRGIINDLQQQWILLTDEQRACWVLYTKLFPIKQKNINGNVINAQQTFIKVNAPFRLYNIPIIIDPVLTPSVLTNVAVPIMLTPGILAVLGQKAYVSADEFVVLSMTYPKPPTVNNPGTTYKSIIFATVNSSTINITTEYTDLFGRLPIVGEKVFYKSHIVDKLIGVKFGPTSGLVIFL